MVMAGSDNEDFIEYSDEEFAALPPLEKWDVLVQEKRDVEAELGALNSTRFREEHAKILRRGLPEKVSRETWIKRRTELTQHRTELLARKVEVEDLLQELRPEVELLKAKRRDLIASDTPVVGELRRLVDTVAKLVDEVKLLRAQEQHGAQHDQNAAQVGIAG